MTTKPFKNVYQFRISLVGIRPPIWRRIQVPENFTFFELHVAIQAAMGWQCAHLHEFHILHPKKHKKVRIVSEPEEEMFYVSEDSIYEMIKEIKEDETLSEEQKQILLDKYKRIMDTVEEIFDEVEEKISDWFSPENNVARYIYDFGDWFEHKIKLEKILPRDSDTKYPICLAGKRACPPEDCGGPRGYMEFLKALKNPQDEESKELIQFYGNDFDPEYFDLKSVNYDKFRRYFRKCI